MEINDELYQEALLQHSRRPKNYGAIEGATHRAEGLNPSCGDEISLELCLEGGQIKRMGFVGQSCAICTASASMMTMEATGLKDPDARALSKKFRDLLLTGNANEVPPRLAVLSGVHRFPARVKCAALPWETLVAALDHPIA